MFNEFCTAGTPMLCQILRHLNTKNILTAEEVGDLLSIVDPYPYLSTRDMDWSQVRTIFRGARRRKQEVQLSLLQNLTVGEGWLHQKIDADCDINGDGVVDMNDVLDGAIDAIDTMGRVLVIARKEAANGRKQLMPGRADDLQQKLNRTLKRLLEVQQVITFLNEQTRRSA